MGPYLSGGAALFNSQVAARMLGCDPLVRSLPDLDYLIDILAVIEVGCGSPPTPGESELYESVRSPPH